MRIARIRNKYIYKDKNKPNDNGNHAYLIFFNRRSKAYNAVQLTHIYIKDPKREQKLKSGHLMEEKFSNFKLPSGVKDTIITKDFEGRPLDIRNKNIIYLSKNHIPSKQKERIFKFLSK